MLKLLLGTDWVANRDTILNMVTKDVAEEKGNRILLVPELISHDIERRLCASAGDTASRFAEVLSFTRLVRSVAEYTEHGIMPCLDKAGQLASMASAARQLHSKLKSYASVETKPEFLTGLVSAVEEFKQCCVTSKDLMKASSESQGSLAQKLEELSLLLDTYDAVCAQGKRDPADQMTWLLSELEDCDFARDHVFYVEGFPDFTRQNMSVLEHIVRNASYVTVALACDKPNTENVSFERAGQTAAYLLRFAKDNNIPYEVCYQQEENCPTALVRQRLFRGQTQCAEQVRDCLFTYRQDSVYNECVAAAKKIMQLVHNGCRYRDIGIVCCDMAAYRNAISLVSQKFQIPLYLSGTEPILEKPPVISLIAAIEAALGGFEQGDILRYIKSIYSPLDQKTADDLENYVYLWKVRGEEWNRDFTMHPDGLGGIWTERVNQRLAELNSARRVAMQPLVNLRKAFRDATNLRQQVMGVYDFFLEISLSQRLDKLARQMDASGDLRNGQILRQLWDILLSALEQLYDALGDTVWDSDTFTRLLTLLLSQYDVGTIPPVLDAVMAGPVDAMRCQQVKHLFVLGAAEGSLPNYGNSAGVLTEQERNELRKLGITLQYGAMDTLQGEFSNIYDVFCGARESVTVSCSAEQPSFVMRRLTELSGGEREVDVTLGTASGNPTDASALLTRYKDGDNADLLGISAEYERFLKSSEHSLGCVSNHGIRSIYGDQLRLSASQVDKQADCRLAYFLRYGLNTKERKTAEIDPAEFGTYVHYVLEQTGRKVMELGGFKDVTLEETIEIADGFSCGYARERFGDIGTERQNYLLQRNRHELFMVVEELWKELQSSAFLPKDFELSFGDDGKLDAITIPGAAIAAQLRGFVDRVDIWQQGDISYFRVVDYKTGRKTFDYCDILNGLGLQMLLYLFALEDNGQEFLGNHPVPAGVQYFPARAPVISADYQLTTEDAEKARQSEWKRRGLVLRDEDVLKAMQDDENFSKISVKISKDGSIGGDVATAGQLGMLKKYVFSQLRDMVNDIASGNISPNPYTRGAAHNACRYCPYGEICHPAYVEGRRDFAAVSPAVFWNTVEKEAAENGR